MKLVVLTNILTPYRIPLFAALQRRVDELTVLLMSEREENRQWELDTAPFQTRVLPGIHLRPPGAEVSLHVNYGTIRALRRLNPDVVLSGGFTPANLAAAMYCRLFNKRYFSWGEVTRRDHAARSTIRNLMRRFIVGSATGCIASSREARDTFVSYGIDEHRVLLAPMPIDVDFFRRRARDFRRTPECRMLRERHTEPVLLSVGRITQTKGYGELFEIYRRVLQVKPGATLLLVGDGPQRPAYEKLVKDAGWTRVHFVGFVQAAELPAYLAVADVFVFHTLFDPFGAVAIEAMAAGVPVASSIHAASTHDFVDDGVTGVRIDPRDAPASAEAVLKLLNLSPDERATVVNAAYRRVKRFDIKRSAAAMLEFMTTHDAARAGATVGRSHGR